MIPNRPNSRLERKNFPLSGRGYRSRAPLDRYNTWFLESGSWDEDGLWVDYVPWEETWFLESGRINIFGVWDDSEAWT